MRCQHSHHARHPYLFDHEVHLFLIESTLHNKAHPGQVIARESDAGCTTQTESRLRVVHRVAAFGSKRTETHHRHGTYPNAARASAHHTVLQDAPLCRRQEDALTSPSPNSSILDRRLRAVTALSLSGHQCCTSRSLSSPTLAPVKSERQKPSSSVNRRRFNLFSSVRRARCLQNRKD